MDLEVSELVKQAAA